MSFAIIGDVHGCFDELLELVEKLNNPDRTFVFVGDLVSRGPESVKVIRFVRDLCLNNKALCVLGNHDDKILRWARGNPVKLSHGDQETAPQILEQNAVKEVISFFSYLPLQLILDNGSLVVVHAAWKPAMLDPTYKNARTWALYGPTRRQEKFTGSCWLPDRIDWAAERIENTPFIVCGHQFYKEPRLINETCHIDTGCCFGGKLSCFLWPEKEIVQVSARAIYDKSKMGEL